MELRRRTDLRRWSTTVAILTCFLYTSLSLILLSGLLPRCFCSEAYAHITAIPVLYVLLYIGLCLYNIFGVIASIVVVRQVGLSRNHYLLLYLVITLTTELAVLSITALALFLATTNVIDYQDIMISTAKDVFLKEEVSQHFDQFLESVQGFMGILKSDLDITDEVLDMHRLMEMILKPEVFVVSQAALNALKMWSVFQMIFINVIFLLTASIIYLYCRSFRQREKLKKRLKVSEVTINKDLSNSEWEAILKDGTTLTIEHNLNHRRHNSLSTHTTMNY